MKNTNLQEGEVYMGFITSGICKECGDETFAADGVCHPCKVRMAEEDRLYFKSPLGLECD